ncbi:hypothetical protein [uncultured Mediterranean phage uvDeep-CGR2-KM23-C246]|nr:hypothetical protein [uncultured Mediterranean phage uvDeep-CGR2-KM23-C246]
MSLPSKVPSPGRRSRNKGARVEREIVALHHALGIEAERVPLSGAAGGSFAGDVIVDKTYRVEVKARKDGAGFALIERWLAGNDMLIVKSDRKEPIVVLPWSTYGQLMTGE